MVSMKVMEKSMISHRDPNRDARRRARVAYRYTWREMCAVVCVPRVRDDVRRVYYFSTIFRSCVYVDRSTLLTNGWST